MVGATPEFRDFHPEESDGKHEGKCKFGDQRGGGGRVRDGKIESRR